MKYLKLATVLAGVLLAAGMGSANLLDTFGTVSGEADVEGPTFWTDSSGELLLEDLGGQTGSTLEQDESESWRFEELHGNSWYEMNPDLFLRASITDDSSQEEVEVELELRYIDEEGTARPESSCESTVTIDDQDTNNYDTDCESDFSDLDVYGFRYQVANNQGGEIRFSQGSDTRVEVNAQ